MANLDVGTRALRDGRGEEREEGFDGRAGEGGRVSAEEGGGEGCFGDGERRGGHAWRQYREENAGEGRKEERRKLVLSDVGARKDATLAIEMGEMQQLLVEPTLHTSMRCRLSYGEPGVFPTASAKLDR